MTEIRYIPEKEYKTYLSSIGANKKHIDALWEKIIKERKREGIKDETYNKSKKIGRHTDVRKNASKNK